MTAVTVFVIAVAYNQVIELFPSGGGGYKVATRLLGAHAGLVSGCALVVDYVLTIATSAASGVDAFVKLCRQARAEFPNIVFFASRLVFDHETWLTRLLHNQIVNAMQRRLQAEGMQMVILPMRVPG